MSYAPFVHLRAHSAYSLSESTLRIGALAKYAASDFQPALAITDSFNMFGAFEFCQKMLEVGVQPLVGVSVSISDEKGMGNIVLLAQTEKGYINLCQLVSEALLATDPASEPVISHLALSEKSGGLIVLSGGVRGGFAGQPAANGQRGLTLDRINWLKSVFGDRVYIELQRHGLASERDAEPVLLDIAQTTDVRLVATNDCHFDSEDMFEPHRVLTCIASSERLASMSENGFTAHHSFKSAKEMVSLFSDIPEALENTLHIAQRCSFVVNKRDPILPSTGAEDEAAELRKLSHEGLTQRLAMLSGVDYFDESEAGQKPYFDRLERELDIIIEMGFPGYFLIVSDFIRWAKGHQIPVGPGRGSGAGSVVAWALAITDLDPLRWGLLFERFLNPERVSMPDFDIDFCQERREEVIHYVQEKYGRDRVAQIITFGSLQARAALRDVGRVLDMSYGQVDRIAKLIPNNPAKPITISEALASEPELSSMISEDEQVAHLVTTATKLEGLYRHASTHAAGLVIADRSLPELVPVYRDPRSDMPVTQFNMKSVEQVGLVKFDFLGLKTLTVIQKTVELLAIRNIELDINTIPLDDTKTYDMLADGDTVGIFQLESSGMREVLRGLKPDRFEDIIAVLALYRPGPMENIPTYISRKHGRELVEYMHPLLEPILFETYGIMIYQEQVQQAARDLAGYTLGGADILRRAMGKKIKAEMDMQRKIFVNGSENNGIESQLASNIFDQIASFAGYGFNKSHAAAYALVCYQTAWLKANYPVEFIAASMALDFGNTDKLSVFRQECLCKDIPILAPDINYSDASFTVEDAPDKPLAIRYALGAIRNVGSEAMVRLVSERQKNGQFSSLGDLAKRLPREGGNKRQLENLAQAGAFDSLHKNRRQMFESLDQLIQQADLFRREAESQQKSLFRGENNSVTDPKFRFSAGPDWTNSDRLAREFEALGLYLSSHPLDAYQAQLESLKIVSSQNIKAVVKSADQKPLKLAGQVTAIQERVSVRGNRFAFVQFTDKDGMFEVIFFSETLSNARSFLESDVPVLVTVERRVENDAVRLLAQRVQSIDEAIALKMSSLGIWISDEGCLDELHQCLKEDGGGKAQVKLFVQDDRDEIEVTLAHKFKLSGELRHRLKSIKGIADIKEINQR